MTRLAEFSVLQGETYRPPTVTNAPVCVTSMIDPRLITVLLARLDETWASLVDAMTTAASQSITGLEVPNDELRQALDASAGIFRKAIAEDDHQGLQAARLRALAAQWSIEGIPLEGILDALEAAQRVQFRHLMSMVAGAPAEERARVTQELALRTLTAQAAVQRAAVSGFADSQVESVPAEAVQSMQWVAEVIAGAGEPPPSALDANVAWGVVVLVPRRGGSQQSLRDVAHHLASPAVWQGPTAYEPIRHVSLLVQVAETHAWASTVNRLVSEVTDASTKVRAIASVTAGPLVMVAQAYERCRRNLAFVRMVPEEYALLDAGTLQMWRTLSDSSALERACLFECALGVLVEQAPDILWFLDSLVAAGSQHGASERVGRTRQTVGRQLRTMKSLTGYDWRDPAHRAVITLAVLCRWLAAVSAAGYDEGTYGPAPTFSALGAITARRHA